jgi:Protein of unknown function (DUF1573)
LLQQKNPVNPKILQSGLKKLSVAKPIQTNPKNKPMKLPFFILCCLLCANICFAQTPTVLEGITINVLSHDFGSIPKSQEVEYVFELKNQTDKPFLIDNVRTTCGCTAASWQQDPVLPNTITRLPISFDARNKGYFNKKIKIYLSNYKKPIVINITGEVE